MERKESKAALEEFMKGIRERKEEERRERDERCERTDREAKEEVEKRAGGGGWVPGVERVGSWKREDMKREAQRKSVGLERGGEMGGFSEG